MALRLPPEILLDILANAVELLPPRARTRSLADFSTVSRHWHHPARSLLFATPALPARCVWLLSRTLRHAGPDLAKTVTSLDVWGVSVDGLLLALLSSLPRLRDVRIRVIKARTSEECDWGRVLDLLEARAVAGCLTRLSWVGGNPRELSRTFGWPLAQLSVHEHDFHSVEPLLRRPTQPVQEPMCVFRPVVRKEAFEADHDLTLRSPTNPTLETLSLSQTTFPYNFFDRLHPFLGALTSLSLQSSRFYSSDLDRSLLLLPTLRFLSLLGEPSGGRALLAASFNPLTSLTTLVVSGILVEPAVFTSLPPSVTSLVIVPGKLEPDKLHLELLRRKVGLDVGSQGLEVISLRFVSLDGRRDRVARERWEASRDRLGVAAVGLGDRTRTLEVRYLD